MDDEVARLAARIQRLEDHEAIRRLLQDYRRTLDARDFAAYSELFAPDGEWHSESGHAKGPAAVRAMVEPVMGADGPIGSVPNLHLVVNPVIEVDGDRADAESTFVFIRLDDAGKPAVTVVGHYSDRFVRENGRWRFESRMTHTDIPAQPT
jgi:uncharacterized protein (TIGR02246 family)